MKSTRYAFSGAEQLPQGPTDASDEAAVLVYEFGRVDAMRDHRMLARFRDHLFSVKNLYDRLCWPCLRDQCTRV